MGKIKFDQPKPLIKNKFFYVALTLALVALGVSSYATVSRLRQYENVPSSTPESMVASEVDKPVSDVPYPPAESHLSEVTATDLPVKDETLLSPAAPFFSMPVPGEILKDFDPDNLQYSETYKDWRLHLGVDIAAQKGDVIYSAAQGVVDDIYNDPILGTVVAIDHGEGLVAFYCGLNATPTVAIDDSVEAGSQLGVLDVIPGESVEQPHLHLEMEQDGNPVAPLVAMGMMQ